MIIDRAKVDRNALQGKVAIVSGAGQGIGRETARVLAHLGAVVVIAEINPTGALVEREITAQGGQALFVQTDVADPHSMQNLASRVAEAFGTVHILINNAEAYLAKPTLDHTLEEWDRLFAVNLRGAFLGIQHFLPGMLEHGEGTIITMRSSDGMPYASAYFASKVGLSSLARSLAGELGEDSPVSVYCFGPGAVDTPATQAAFPQLAALYGMTTVEFTQVAAPGGKMISAELSATGLVGTILHARRFHGEDVDYFVGLQQVGLDSSGEPFDAAVIAANTTPEGDLAHSPQNGRDSSLPSSDLSGLLQQAIHLNNKMEEILRANLREYDELPRFVRPVVKRMFQQGTGLKVEDWLASAEEMTRRLQDGTQASRLDAYLAQLQRMGEYIVKQEADARGWFKEPDKLKMALDGLRDRQAVVRELSGCLEQVRQAREMAGGRSA